jgi:tape measure domain-containing protein
MAKQVAPLDIKVGIQGLEELTRLKSAFKGLTSTIDITDDAINKATDGIKEYVRSANNSEAVIKGQVEAFRKLKSQADITGSTYKKLDGEIKRLEQELKGASEGLIRQRDALVKSATSTKNSSTEVAKYIAQLKKLQSQTRVSSQAFNDLEADIESLTFKMRQLRQEELADFGKNAVNATKGAIGGLQTGIQQSINLFKRLGEQSKTAFGQVARTVEGITAVGVGGAVAGGGAGALGGLSGLIQGAGASLSGLKGGLGAVPFAGEKLQALVSPEAIARLNEAASNVAALQAKVAGLDQAMDAVTNAFTAFGPTASAGAIAASAGIAIIYDRLRNAAEETRVELEKSFTGIDDEVQGLIRSLTKLRDQIQSLSTAKINELLAAARQRFAAAPAGTPLSRSMASQIAGLEAVGREEAGRQAVVLEEYRQRVRGTSEAAVDLAQRLSFLKGRLQEVDTSTTEGKAEFARLSNESVQLSEQIRKLGDSYRYVGQMATEAATAQENAANAATRANYFNRAAVRAQEQALAELGQRVRAGVAATPLALPAAGQTTAAGTGQEISGGARRLTGQTEFTFGEAQFRNPRAIEFMGRQGLPSAATGISGATGLSDPEAAYRAQANAARAAAIDLSQYRVAIDNAARANNGSVNSIGKLRDAIAALRNQLSPADGDFNRLTKRIQELDAQSERLQVRQGRRRMTGMQMSQAAGAALSGGIFGGPEGFLGGAIGSAFGVGGAFAGAAFGAQIGGLRQQLGGFADYAAQIQKMEIALRSAVKSQADFNRAMAAAEDVTRNLNVPQDVAIGGMTKLTAAVTGAKGPISDAELVLKNVTAAIKATGGSAQDVDGAITAMVQVFSKGKVSAEELSGQLGERLPGAVTKFAKANDMTLPELQKALEQGQVGLNELMKFIEALGAEYADVAQAIAGSSEEAGARLNIAFNDMRIAIGESLQPIGAQFQEIFVNFIENISPALVATLPKIGEAVLTLANNFDSLAIAVAGFTATLGVAKLVAFVAQLGGIALALKQVGVLAAGAASAIMSVNLAALANPWVALAAGIAAASVALYKHNQAQKEYKDLIDNGVGSTEQLKDTQQRLEKQLEAARRSLEDNGSGMQATGRQAMQLKMKIAELENQLARINKTFKIRLSIERQGIRVDDEGKMVDFTVAGIVYDAQGNPVRRTDGRPLNAGVRGYDDPSSTKSGAGKAKKERESQLPQLMAQLAMQQQIAQINEKIRNAQLAENQFLQIRLEGERELAQIAGEIKAIAFEKIPADEAEVKRKLLMLKADETRANIALKLQQTEKQNLIEITQQSSDLADSYTTQIEDRQRLQELIATGMKEALALEYIQIENILEKEKERLEVRKALLQEAGDIGGAKATQDLIDRLDGKEVGLKSLAAAAQPEEKGKLQQFIEQAEAELKDFEALAVRISQNIGNAIGNSIANGITGLIEGTTTAKEIFASFLRDVGQILIQEGAKMIATYIAIGIARAFAGLQSSTTSSTGPNPGGIPSTGNVTAPSVNGFDTGSLANIAANGAYFDNGTAYFAKGGIVTRPTFFKFANGGQMRNGLMGEAGPEAIVPLKRGPDGRLGISMYTASRKAVANTEAMAGATTGDSGYEEEMALGGVSATRRSVTASAAQAVMATRMQVSEQRSISERRSEMRQIQEIVAKPAKINVEFQSQVINNVEYVTREQAERMAAQSALRGRELAIGSLQNSVKTRKRVGMA